MQADHRSVDAGIGDSGSPPKLAETDHGDLFEQYGRPVSRLDRIVTDPAVCHGLPTVCGLRIPVTTVLALLASDMTFEEILEDYPDLERDDLLASLEFGALATAQVGTIPPEDR